MVNTSWPQTAPVEAPRPRPSTLPV
jgi:hypothetical protein